MTEFIITEAILIGIVAGVALHRLIGYLTIPIVGLGVGVWWASRHAGDVEGGTADIYTNAAPELLAGTGLTFTLSAIQAAVACWATISALNYVRTRLANRKAKALNAPDRTQTRRPT